MVVWMVGSRILSASTSVSRKFLLSVLVVWLFVVMAQIARTIYWVQIDMQDTHWFAVWTRRLTSGVVLYSVVAVLLAVGLKVVDRWQRRGRGSANLR